MNANELADELEMLQVAQYGDRELCVAPTKIHKEAATMLRAQQAEIEALNEQLGRFMKHYNEMAQELERTKEAGKTLSELVEPLLRGMGKLK